MEVRGIEELMRLLKGRYDASERRSRWRALSGRDHVSGVHDTFVFSDDSVYQIVATRVSKDVMVAVGDEVGSGSEDFEDIVRQGSPVPLGMVSRAPNASAVMMFGMQQYSSDVAEVLRDEYFGSKQDRLRAELDSELDRILRRPEFRASYRNVREDETGYFA